MEDAVLAICSLHELGTQVHMFGMWEVKKSTQLDKVNWCPCVVSRCTRYKWWPVPGICATILKFGVRIQCLVIVNMSPNLIRCEWRFFGLPLWTLTISIKTIPLHIYILHIGHSALWMEMDTYSPKNRPKWINIWHRKFI